MILRFYDYIILSFYESMITRSRCRDSDLPQRRAQWGEQGSAASRSPTISVPSGLSSVTLAGDDAGGQLVSPLPMELPQTFLSCPPTAQYPVYPAGNATRAYAPSTRSPEQTRVTPAQGAAPGRAVGGGGEEAPRAEQSRGWRGWPRCSWVGGAAAGGSALREVRGLRVVGAAISSVCPASFRPRARLSPPARNFCGRKWIF